MEVKATEIGNGKVIEIVLPDRTIKVRAFEAAKSPVVRAEVNLLSGGGFQVTALQYANAAWSHYLGNCFTKKGDDGIWY
jgi:hypothetical protein